MNRKQSENRHINKATLLKLPKKRPIPYFSLPMFRVSIHFIAEQESRQE